LIDNIYLNIYEQRFFIFPHINGLSDHDAQIIILPDISSPIQKQVFSPIRKLNNASINNFTHALSYEIWDDVFCDVNINIVFNSFLNTFLKIFNASFPTKKFFHYKKNPG
jgi:hypothetical protein